jgi:hypothetical protein
LWHFLPLTGSIRAKFYDEKSVKSIDIVKENQSSMNLGMALAPWGQ